MSIDAPDPRGIRVSVVGAEAGGPDPILIEPGPAPIPGAGAGDGRSATSDGDPINATIRTLGPGRAVLVEASGGASHHVLRQSAAATSGSTPPGIARHEVVIDGWRFEIDVQSATRAALEDRARRDRAEAGGSGPTEVHAIIPGVVVSVSVARGDAVTAGQQLLVVEAMKMQNELRAPRDGTIERVSVGAGTTIDVGDLLLVIA